MQKTEELFRHAGGVESRSIQLTLTGDGAITLSAQDSGSSADQMFGARDHEFTVTIPAHALASLAFVLLRERYRGQPNSVDILKDLCRREEIPHKLST